MNPLLNTQHAAPSRQERTPLSNLAYGACSALMPYVLATVLLIAFS